MKDQCLSGTSVSHRLWALTQEPKLERSWEKGSRFFAPIREEKCLVTCMNHILMSKTWTLCTIPFIGIVIVKIYVLTTTHTCAGMFPPEAWHWCKAGWQWTCQLHVNFCGPSNICIEFISAKYLIIPLNHMLCMLRYVPTILQYYIWVCYLFFSWRSL